MPAGNRTGHVESVIRPDGFRRHVGAMKLPKLAVWPVGLLDDPAHRSGQDRGGRGQNVLKQQCRQVGQLREPGRVLRIFDSLAHSKASVMNSPGGLSL